MVSTMPGKFLTGVAALDIVTGTMNPPREDQSAGQETVHAESTGGSTPPIRTQTGLPADRAKLLDRGRHGSQVPEAREETRVFPRREPNIAEKNPARTPPGFASIHEQLRSSKYVTLQLLWEEYRQGNPEGYRTSRFRELYHRWRSKLDVALRQIPRPPMASWTGWYTTRTASRCVEIRCARIGRSRMHRRTRHENRRIRVKL